MNIKATNQSPSMYKKGLTVRKNYGLSVAGMSTNKVAHEKMRFEPVISGSSDNGRRFGKQVNHNMSMILDRNANANLTNSGL